jgi:hypothetical protein
VLRFKDEIGGIYRPITPDEDENCLKKFSLETLMEETALEPSSIIKCVLIYQGNWG